MAVDLDVDEKTARWQERQNQRATEPVTEEKYPVSSAIPAFDRVLVKVLPIENKGLIQTAGAFEEPSNRGTVVSKGQSVFLGGHVLSIPFDVGDVVQFGMTAMEEVTLEGEKYGLIRAQDVRLFWLKRP
jgi:chaperonin GroES